MILQKKTPLTADNVNYTVLFKPGTLQVQPKPLGVAWNTDGTVIDTGERSKCVCRIYRGIVRR